MVENVDSCANIFLNGGAKCQEGRNDSQDELKAQDKEKET
jgi:hypothetical protein